MMGESNNGNREMLDNHVQTIVYFALNITFPAARDVDREAGLRGF